MFLFISLIYKNSCFYMFYFYKTYKDWGCMNSFSDWAFVWQLRFGFGDYN